MKQIGRITALKENEATVEIRMSDRCRHCTMQQSCVGCEEEHAFLELTAVNEIGAKVGDRVVISSGEEKLFLMASLCYILPMLIGVIGYLAVYLIWQHRVAAALTALGLFAVSLIAAGRGAKKATAEPMRYRIKQIVEQKR